MKLTTAIAAITFITVAYPCTGSTRGMYQKSLSSKFESLEVWKIEVWQDLKGNTSKIKSLRNVAKFESLKSLKICNCNQLRINLQEHPAPIAKDFSFCCSHDLTRACSARPRSFSFQKLILLWGHNSYMNVRDVSLILLRRTFFSRTRTRLPPIAPGSFFLKRTPYCASFLFSCGDGIITWLCLFILLCRGICSPSTRLRPKRWHTKQK